MRLIEKFNHQNTFLVISDYPEKTTNGEKNYGIAWYTKETIEPLAKKHKAKFVVLAEKAHDNEPKLYQNGQILVLRVFDQKRFTLFPRILKWLLVFSKIKKVYVHSEFCTNGGLKNFIFLIPFLSLIKLTGKNITFFAHNVVTELNSIAPHLNLKKGSLNLLALNAGLKIYYFLLGKIVNRIVVMDEVIEKRISRFVNSKKIIFTPMWVKKSSYSLSQKKAKEKLGLKNSDFLVLSFGFVTWYKGADWLIKTFKKLLRKNNFANYHLILAGGEAYSLKEKEYYQKFYHQLLEFTKKEKRIRITGFVKEADIGLYFKASDLAIFPYRGLIGSSGALSYALSFKKPFIVSDKMKIICQNTDFSNVLKKIKLKPSDISFKLNVSSLETLLVKAKNKQFLGKITTVSSFLAKERSFDKWIDSYYNRIYINQECQKELVKNIKFSGYAIHQPAIK